LDCTELTTEYITVKQKVKETSDIQDAQATVDTASMTLGALFFFPLMLAPAISGGNRGNATALSNLKGQQNALESSMAKSGCTYAPAQPPATAPVVTIQQATHTTPSAFPHLPGKRLPSGQYSY